VRSRVGSLLPKVTIARRSSAARARVASERDERKRLLEEARPHASAIVSYSELGPYAVSTADWGKGRNIFVHGRYPRDLTGQALELLLERGLDPRAKGRLFVDVGAYTGCSTIPALLRHFFHGAVAIEPEPGNYRLLRANLVLNDLDEDVRAVRCAISDHEASAMLRVNPDMHGAHAIVERRRLRPRFGSLITVDTLTLDTLLDRENLSADSVGLVKIDVQGHEDRVLAGASSLLEAGVPIVLEYDANELSTRRGALDSLEALAREHYAWFADLREASEGQTAGPLRPITEVAELRSRYPATTLRRGRRRSVTDLLLTR
jgi:FkbM family methyltransferase